MQKRERKTIKTGRHKKEEVDLSPLQKGVGRLVKKDLSLPEDGTPGSKGFRGECRNHIQSWWLHPYTLAVGCEELRARLAGRETAQKKQRTQEEQRKKAAGPGSSIDHDSDQPERKARRRGDDEDVVCPELGEGHGHSR